MKKILLLLIMPFISIPLMAMDASNIPYIVGLRPEFILFAITLTCVAIFHRRTMQVAIIGIAAVLLFKYIFDPEFSLIHHLAGGSGEEGEWRILLNLIGLLFGFGILARHFELSGVPLMMPKYLPNDWKGPFVLLLLIMILSSFLDNIAAAMIGGTIAMVVFKGQVHIGYLAAIIAASNAGGAGSVVGDTTTTLMWIDGVDPLWVLPAFIASIGAFAVFGIIGAKQQDSYERITSDAPPAVFIEYKRLIVVVCILIAAIFTNYQFDFPALGVWVIILAGSFIVKTPWEELLHSWKGTVFLVALVTIASLMPVNDLPQASWQTAFSLGFISAVFDNIPLTKLCLEQGGYDWGILAYAVGFGGSMLWFGSSAGVALSNLFPQARSVVAYVKHGWHVILAYVIGFFLLLAIAGWNPHPPHKNIDKADVNTEYIIH